MIKRRMCSHCGLYLSSLKAKSLHGASCRVTEGRTENTTERVQPLRVAGRRQRYLLCVMAFQEMEWASLGRPLHWGVEGSKCSIFPLRTY